MKRAKAKENHVERANMTKKRDIKEEEKEDKQRAKRKKWERERENEDNLEIGQYREGRKKKNNDNNGRIERDMLPVSHATVRYPKQIRETCSGREENTKSKRRHASFVPRTDLESASALGSVEKKRTRASTSSAQQLLRCHTNGFSMRTHAGRMSGQSLKHLHLQIHGELPHLQKK